MKNEHFNHEFTDDFDPPTEEDFMVTKKVEKPKIKRKIGCCVGCLVVLLFPVVMIIIAISKFFTDVGNFFRYFPF